jgi:hypothetical protein
VIRPLGIGLWLAGLLTPVGFALFATFRADRHVRETGYLPDGIGSVDLWVLGMRISALMFLVALVCAVWSYAF